FSDLGANLAVRFDAAFDRHAAGAVARHEEYVADLYAVGAVRTDVRMSLRELQTHLVQFVLDRAHFSILNMEAAVPRTIFWRVAASMPVLSSAAVSGGDLRSTEVAA